MKNSRILSAFSTFLMAVGLLTFIPTIEAEANANCVGDTCTQTFNASASAQTFTPPAAGITLRITVNGASGARGGGDAGGGGGAAIGGNRIAFDYVATSTDPLNLYIGNAGGAGSTGACSGAGAAGTNPWTIYNGGRGGFPGCQGTSGAGGGGGSATVISTGNRTGVIAVAGGGAGGGGANVNANGTAGRADTGAQTGNTTGAQGQDWGGDGSGGGGGGGGATGGTGGAASADGWNPGGQGGVTGRNLVPAQSNAVVTSNANTGAGSITITWANGPRATTRPSFTDTATAIVGQVLVPTSGTYTPTSGTVAVSSQRWQISNDGTTWTDISPVVSGDYTIKPEDAGKYVRFTENATDANSTIVFSSNSSLQITGIPAFTAETLSGTAGNTILSSVYAGYTFQASGFRNTFSISDGALPAGITLNPTTGALAGTSTSTGIYKFKVRVTNEAGSDETEELTIVVGRAPVFTSDDSILQSVNRVTNPIRVGAVLPNFVFAAAAFPTATFELKTDSATLPNCGTAPNCAFTFETRALPPGLTFDAATGTLSGTPTQAGAYVFAIQATNSVGTSIETIHMTVARRAANPFTLTSDKSSVVIVQNTTVTATITAAGGDGNGAFSFAVDPSSSAICSVVKATDTTATMTVLAAGNCVINGTKAADGGFAVSRSSTTVQIDKAPQTAPLVITADTSPLTIPGDSTWLRGTGGNGTGAFTWALDPSSVGICILGTTFSGNNMYMAYVTSGTCTYVVTKAGDGFFLPQTTKFSIEILKGTQAAFAISNPGATNWHATNAVTHTLSTSGGSGNGAVTYFLDPTVANACTLSGNVLTARSAGTCTVTAIKAGNSSWKQASAAPVTWTINKIAQTALAYTMTTSNGATFPWNGGTTYVANPTPIVTINMTGGSGTGAYSYVATGNSGCTVQGAGPIAYVYVAATGSGIGSCFIAISKADDVNFLVATTNTQFSFSAAPQAPLVATAANPSMDFVATTLTDPSTAAKTQITVTGGLGNGAVTYAVASGSTTVCSVDTAGLITNKTAGSCVVNVTKAADSNYQVQTTSVTVTFNKLNQAELVANPADASEPFVWSPKATNQITTTGGAGTGAVTYAVDPSTSSVCSVGAANGLITDITAGTCLINVTKAADTNYNVTTDQVSVVFTKIDPAAITLTAAPTSLVYTPAANKNQTWVTVAGGANSTGANTFFIDPMTEENCSIATVQANRVLVNANLAGFCLVTVIQAADVNYNEIRTMMGFNITKMVQTINATSSAGTNIYYVESPTALTTINVTGQSGTGITRYVVDPTANTSNCSVDQSTGKVTTTTVGTCRITVSRDGDDNVAASNSVVLNLTAVKINQGIMALTAEAGFKLASVGSTASTSPLTLGLAYTGTGNFTRIVSTTPLVCTITGGGDSTLATPTFTATANPSLAVTAVNDGTCTLQYTKLGDANFNVATNFTASFTINKATQAEFNASITAGSESMPFVMTPKATATVTGTGGSGTGAINYTVAPASSTICSVNLTTGVVTSVTAGICVINAKRLTDNDYAESEVRVVTITFTKIDQTPLVLAAAKTALRATTALDTTTLSTTGGLGTGAVTYAVDASSAGICSISGTTVTGLGAGDCNITATKAADVNYNVATATIKLTITKGTQAALVVNPYWATIGYIPPTPADASLVNAFVWSGGTGAGDLVFTIDPASSGVCNRAGMRPGIPSHIQVFAVGSGTCTISVFKSGGTAWENSNTVVSSFTITKIAQAAITATPSRTSVPFFDSPAATFTVAVTGGTGDGLTSVSINPASAAICSDATVEGGVITVRTLGVGNCLLSGVKAASAGYTQVTSAQITVTITKGTQAPIVMSASPSELTFAVSPRATSTLTVTGGSGNGAVTVAVDSGSTAVCSYNSVTGVITAIQAGRCDLTATKAAGADGLFNAATGTLSVVINKIPQARLNLTAVTPFITFVESPVQKTALTLTGGSGTGAVSYAVEAGSSSVCTVNVANGIATVTANYFGFCVIRATKAGDANYAEAVATTTVRISQPGTQIIATVPNASESFVPAPGVVSIVTVEGSAEGDILSYSVDKDSKDICAVSGTGTTARVTSLAQGVCNVIAINVARAPDGTLIASSSVATFTITKGQQLDVVLTPAEDKTYFAIPAATNVITVTGGVPTSTITAAVDSASADICSVTVTGNKITMIALQVGDCLINVTKEGNAGFLDYETSITIPVLRTKQADLFATATPGGLTYSPTDVVTTTLSTVGGSGTGAVTYAVTEASASICSVTGNVVTVITGGDCVVIATKAGDVNFAEMSAAVTIKIAKGNQTALEVEAADETLQYVLGETIQTGLTTTGGSGDGAITYEVAEDSALICALDGTNVVVLKAGTCVITATKASDAFFKEVTGTVTIIIAKGVQAEFTVDTRDESIQYLVGSLVRTELLPSGGSGTGVVSYVVAEESLLVCALQGSNIVALRAGSCTITATRASDSDFLATSASTTIEITKSPQVPLVLESDDETLAYIVNTSVTTRLSITGGSGTGAVVYAVASGSTSVCSIAGNVVTALTSGNCELTVTKASDANYLEATDSLVITITKGLQAALTVTAANQNLAYSPTDVVTTTLSTVGGSGEGEVTYAVSPASASICSVEGNVVTVVTGGDCVVVATKAGDITFEPATANTTIKIAKSNQEALVASADDSTLQYVLGETVQTNLSTTGGSGTGAVSYAVAEASATICSVDGNTVTVLKAGTCTVTATKASDAFFNAATDTVEITINKGIQTPLSLATEDASLQHNFDTVVRTALLPTGGSGNGAITYTIAEGSLLVCALQGSNIVSLRPGSCTITATKAADSDFLSTSASVTVEITKANQTSLVLASEDDTLAYVVNTSVTTRLSVTGGSGNGAVTYAVAESSSTVCSVSGNIVTALTSGNCELIATKAGDANYLEATDSLVITITKGLQAALTASAANPNLTYSASNAVTTTVSALGGSGTGEVTYAVSPASASVCSVSGNVVTVITGGDCVIVATKAGDVTFEPATATTTIKIAKGTQAALVLIAEDETLVFNKDVPAETGLLVTGGSGDGEIEFSIAPSSAAICELDGSNIIALRAGTCVVIATKQEDAFFEEATDSLSITIEKAGQDALVANTAQGHTSTPDWNRNNETQMVISGGDGFGALTVESLTPAICSVELAGSRVNVTAHAEGNCQFRVNKDGDYNYLAATALTHTMVVGTTDTDLAISIKPVTTHVAGRAGGIEITVTNVSDAAAAGVTVEYTLPYGFAFGSPLPAGCRAASASMVSCTSAAVIAAGGNLKFVIPVVVPDSFDGGELTKGASAALVSKVEDSTLENNAVTGNAANFIVHRAPGEFSKSELEPMQTGSEFSDQIEAVGFPSVTYSVTAGVLPAGLTLDPATGEISGTPTGFGAYSFTITASNAAGSASIVYSGSIAPIPVVTVPGSGFSTNTVPAGTRVTIVGTNLDLITSAIIGGRSANIFSKTATQIVLDVPNSNTATTVPITLNYEQGNLVGGSFTYTGVSKLNPVIVISAGTSAAGAAEAPRTLTATITATGAPGQITLPVIYSSKTTSICTVTGNQLNFLAAGTCTVTANTASTALFNAGTATDVSITVVKSDQTINAVLPQNTVPPTKATDSADGFELTATATSNLPVVFKGTTPLICDVTEGGFVTGIKPGVCIVTVTQPGSTRFNAAAPARMEFTITKDAGGPSVDPGDPSKPTSLAGGALTNMGDAAFSWNKTLGHLKVETYGIWIGKISAVSEFRIAGKAYKCTVDFGTLKAMPSKTAAQLKAAMAKKTFKAATPFCNSKTEAAAFTALKKGFNGLQVKVTISRFRMYPTTYKPINAKTKKPITTQIRTVYLTLG